MAALCRSHLLPGCLLIARLVTWFLWCCACPCERGNSGIGFRTVNLQSGGQPGWWLSCANSFSVCRVKSCLYLDRFLLLPCELWPCASGVYKSLSWRFAPSLFLFSLNFYHSCTYPSSHSVFFLCESVEIVGGVDTQSIVQALCFVLVQL